MQVDIVGKLEVMNGRLVSGGFFGNGSPTRLMRMAEGEEGVIICVGDVEGLGQLSSTQEVITENDVGG